MCLTTIRVSARLARACVGRTLLPLPEPSGGRPRRRFLIHRILVAMTIALYDFQAPVREPSSIGLLRARAATHIVPST